MRKITLDAFGGPDVLRVREAPDPCPHDDEYVVRLEACGINYADVVERRGRYCKDQSLPFEIGKEGAGVVIERGCAAREFAVGDRVIALRLRGGCYADRVVLGRNEILSMPAHLDFDEGAAFAICYATAWYGMNEVARLRPGESVLIQAAAGGVGTAAIQLANRHGARPVFGTAGGSSKCELVERIGADACFDYTRVDFLDEVRARTGGRGVDYVLESVGGEVFTKSLAALADLGRIVVIGFTSIDSDYKNRIERVHPLTIFHRSIGLAGLNVHNLDFPARRDEWGRLVRFCEEHDVRPVIGARFPLEEAPSAHAALEERTSVGKVLLIP